MEKRQLTFFLEDCGDITLHKKRGVKRLRISIRPESGIRCTVPYGISFNEAIRFIKSKKNWVQTALKKIHDIENKGTTYLPGQIYNTNTYQITIHTNNVEQIKRRILNDKVQILVPDFLDILSSQVQKDIKNFVIEILRKEAKQYLPVRLKNLAGLHGFTFNKVFIKNTKTRWGSCSGKNNINLNLHLVRLPAELADYVILHELVHTVHKNHGKEFWKKLDEITNNKTKQLERELKKFNSQIF